MFVSFRRRSPKKTPQKGLNDDDAEKLSQEAFRLYRTAQNLLNLKEPILSEPKTVPSFHRNSLSDLKTVGCNMQSAFTPPTLQRKIKSRESHNSYQSSSTSDGSVHSNSSSIRTETDEENHLCINGNTVGVNNRRNTINNQAKFSLANDIEGMTLGKDRIKSVASSSADDESGFSSMNSFHHETALPPPPLNSTMISNQFGLDINDETIKNDIPNTENSIAYNNIKLMPEIKSNLPIIHKRFDSAPPIPPKKKLTTFNSIQNENTADKTGGIHVLWV